MKKTHISLTLFILFGFLFNNIALSWDDKVTHKDLSEYAAENSVLDISKGNYMKNLGFQDGLDEEFTWNNVTYQTRKWLREGAEFEDQSGKYSVGYLDGKARAFNHFHNPLKQSPWLDAGLDDWIILPPFHVTGKSSLRWAQDGVYQENFYEGDWSWKKIREHYYTALTGKDFNGNVKASTQGQREEYFAQTFRGLGHQMHLIQDAGQPDHVRNDAHPEDSLLGTRPILGGFYFETWAKKRLRNLADLKAFAPNPVLPNVSLNVSYNNLVPITQFIDAEQYNGASPSTSLAQGIAEYANANFFSDDTIFAAEIYSPGDRHYFPYPKKSSTDLQAYINGTKPPETVTARDGTTDTGIWISKVADGESISYFVRPSFMTSIIYNIFGEGSLYYRTFYRDNICNSYYAEKLIPRAVGYSAGLLDYFFRGTLEVTMPDSYIYSITDGSVTPQQFTRLNAKVRNTTPNEEIQGCDIQQQNCIIQAVARYKKRTDYQPDLSTDPPTATSREADYSYSVSSPIVITSLSSTTPTEFTFDFTNSPIPAGITDLYLHVVFKGTLGNETDIAIAVGMKDLNEPQHFSIWNATDRFYLDGILRTASEIRNDPSLLARVDFNGNGIANETGEPYIDPYDVTTEIAFYPTGVTPTIYNATFTPLPSGRYGRIIILTDMPTFYMFIHRNSTNPPDDMTANFLFSGVTNQDNNGTFQNTQVITFRGIIQHTWSAYARYYPNSVGISTAPWPPPANTNPYPTSTMYP